MSSFFRKRWLLLLVLLVFTLCKIPHLYYAYYWDESWPYAVAITEMHKHGPSLIPGAIDGELARGHPLFFHAAGAVWMGLFGASHLAMHSFALLISLLFLVAVYEAGLRFFNERVATISVILVAMQVTFFVQSSFVLFDMLVALLSFVSFYTYAREKYLWTILSLSALFYTKESGLMAGFVIGIDALINLFNKNTSWRTRLWKVTAIGVPCVLMGIFFLLQKYFNGWYILPYYNDLIEHSWDSFWYNFRVNCVVTTFVMDYRYYYFCVVLAVSLVAAIKRRNAWYLFIFVPFIILYYFSDNSRADRVLPSIPFFGLFVVSVIGLVLSLLRLKLFDTPQQKKIMLLIISFIFVFLCFSAMNFFTPRYMLATIVPLLFFAAVLLEAFIDRTYHVLYYPVLAVIAGIGWYSFSMNNNYGDCDLGAFDGLEVQQHVVDYMEEHNYYDKSVGCLFLNGQHLSNPGAGFLHSKRVFTKIKWAIDKSTDFAIFDNIERDSRYADIQKDTSFKLVDRYQRGLVWAEIYSRK